MQVKILRIKETCLYAKDLERIRHFYHDVLNFPIINYEPEKHIFFRLGESVLLFFNPEDSKTKTSPPPHYAIGKQHFAFEVSHKDYVKAKFELEAKGIKLIDEVVWRSDVRSFYFEDPEGNVLEVLPDRGVWD